MNIPDKIKVDINFVNLDGSARTDIGIYEKHLVCHPDMAQQAIDLFRTLIGHELELIEGE